MEKNAIKNKIKKLRLLFLWALLFFSLFVHFQYRTPIQRLIVKWFNFQYIKRVIVTKEYYNVLTDFKALDFSSQEKIVPLVIKNLSHPDLQIRLAAIRILNIVAPDSEEAFRGLMQALKDKDAKVRFSALQLLEGWNKKEEVLIPIFIKSLADKEKKIQFFSAKYLAERQRKEAIPTLLSFLLPTGKTSFYCWDAKYLLKKLKVEESKILAVYFKGLKSPTVGIRLHVVENLLEYPSPAVINALYLLLKDKNQQVCLATLEILRFLKADFKEAHLKTQVLDILIKGLKSKSPGIRETAAFLICEYYFSFKEVLPELLKLVEDPKHTVREKALNALKKFEREKILPALKQALQHKDPKIQIDAAITIFLSKSYDKRAFAIIFDALKQNLLTTEDVSKVMWGLRQVQIKEECMPIMFDTIKQAKPWIQDYLFSILLSPSYLNEKAYIFLNDFIKAASVSELLQLLGHFDLKLTVDQLQPLLPTLMQQIQDEKMRDLHISFDKIKEMNLQLIRLLGKLSIENLKVYAPVFLQVFKENEKKNGKSAIAVKLKLFELLVKIKSEDADDLKAFCEESFPQAHPFLRVKILEKMRKYKEVQWSMELVEEALKDQKDSVRREAFAFVCTLKEKPKNITVQLAKFIRKEKDIKHFRKEIDMMIQIDKEEAFKLLIVSLNHKNLGFRFAAESKLKEFVHKEKEKLPLLLVEFEKNKEPRVLSKLALLLGGFSFEPAIPVFIARLPNEEATVARSILFALGEMKAQDSIPVVIKALSNRDLFLMEEALSTLEEIAGNYSSYLPELLPLLKIKNLEIQTRLLHLLGIMGPAAKSSLPLLKELLENSNSKLRIVVAETIKKIEQK